MNIDLDKFKNQLKALALLIFGVLIFFICLDFYVWVIHTKHKSPKGWFWKTEFHISFNILARKIYVFRPDYA